MIPLRSLRGYNAPPTRAFDPSTGQVWAEVVLRGPSQARPPRPALLASSAPQQSRAGASSLEAVSIAAILRNIADFTPDHIACLPWPLQEKLARAAAEQYPDVHLAAWQLLAQSSPDGPAAVSYLRQSSIEHGRSPPADLPGWIPTLNSPRCAWLTALTICDVAVPRAALIDLSRLTNLVALDISGDARFVDDRLLADWARRAADTGAFARLRVLVVRKERGITPASLKHAAGLPALTLFGAQDCGVSERDDALALQHRWTAADDSHDLLRCLKREMGLAPSWDGALRACVRCTARPDRPDPPLLNFRLGQIPAAMLFSKSVVFFRRLPSDPSSSSSSSPTNPSMTTTPSAAAPKPRTVRPSRRVALDSLFDAAGGVAMARAETVGAGVPAARSAKRPAPLDVAAAKRAPDPGDETEPEQGVMTPLRHARKQPRWDARPATPTTPQSQP